MSRLLTLQDVADELACSVTTVKRRVRAGKLPVLVDGRLVRVRDVDLRRYILERLRTGSAGGGVVPAPAGRSAAKGRLWD